MYALMQGLFDILPIQNFIQTSATEKVRAVFLGRSKIYKSNGLDLPRPPNTIGDKYPGTDRTAGILQK